MPAARRFRSTRENFTVTHANARTGHSIAVRLRSPTTPSNTDELHPIRRQAESTKSAQVARYFVRTVSPVPLGQHAHVGARDPPWYRAILRIGHLAGGAAGEFASRRIRGGRTTSPALAEPSSDEHESSMQRAQTAGASRVACGWWHSADSADHEVRRCGAPATSPPTHSPDARRVLRFGDFQSLCAREDGRGGRVKRS
jgi:hypothetical protein